MPVEILMPELGESVHEGTVTRWMKKVGDYVKEDEPVVEIMTDKVNQELQAPAAGILVKILIPEGENVQVFAAMGLIEADEAAARKIIAEGGGPEEAASAAPAAQAPAAASAPETAPPAPVDDRRFYSPVVKAMAKEAGLSDAQLASVPGTGSDGRVTKKDIEAYLARGAAAPAAPSPAAQPAPAAPKAPAPAPAAPAPKAAPSSSLEVKPSAAPVSAGPDQEIIPLVGLRKMIADAMVRSAAIPVVSTLIEVDVTSMVEFRARNKEAFAEMYKVKFTYTPFFIKAIAEALASFPMLNASLTPENKVIVNKGVHMGVAVSLGKDGSGGLIVPVIRDAHHKSVIEIARDLEAIAAKARSSQLGVEDVQGGTFTLTNPGSYGATLGTPMINAPQSGILGTYGIVERPVVINRMIAIRSMMNLVLTYDHRLVDGLTAGRFLQSLKSKLEAFDFFR